MWFKKNIDRNRKKQPLIFLRRRSILKYTQFCRFLVYRLIFFTSISYALGKSIIHGRIKDLCCRWYLTGWRWTFCPLLFRNKLVKSVLRLHAELQQLIMVSGAFPQKNIPERGWFLVYEKNKAKLMCATLSRELTSIWWKVALAGLPLNTWPWCSSVFTGMRVIHMRVDLFNYTTPPSTSTESVNRRWLISLL